MPVQSQRWTGAAKLRYEHSRSREVDGFVKTRIGVLLGFALVAGCSDPMDRVERLSDVELAEDVTTVEVAEPASETRAPGGLFARLLQPKTTAPDAASQPDADPVQTAEAAPEGDPAVEAAVAQAAGLEDPAIAAPPKKRGLLGLFAAKDAAEEEAPAVVAEQAVPEQAEVQAAAAAPAEVPQATPDLVEPQKRAGLLGLFGARKSRDVTGVEDGVQVASLGPDVGRTAPEIAREAKAEELAEPEKRRGLFGPRKNKAAKIDPNAPDARLVEAGTALPYGQIARVCGLPRGQMGREVGKYPERGAKYRMYDSAPGNIGPHTFYVTGFPDGCARQFTAALAMFGAPSTYEQLRYGVPSKSMHLDDTDKAYEKIKSKVCGVGRKKPCGKKMNKLEKDTVFISIYERFGGNSRWASVLLHDGTVVARDMKTGG